MVAPIFSSSFLSLISLPKRTGVRLYFLMTFYINILLLSIATISEILDVWGEVMPNCDAIEDMLLCSCELEICIIIAFDLY